ncbi:cupin domain-containing protein [Falsiroseomonas sp. E2-1-a20]|uniref:cupin domain-containing protein n=1 Tax=Falsiroseomonas sp. E2-1-a20 TaxID=3239300 RepID=UPI003F4110F0
MARRIDPAAVPPVIGSAYPAPHDLPCRTRERRRLGDAAGLTQFGVNLLRLPPGAWSSQRHWQHASDEFIHVLTGEVTLVTDAGEEVLRPGDSAGFKAGDPDGHCLRNHTDAEATVLEVGTRLPGDGATYSDIDMMANPAGSPVHYTTKDGRKLG